MRVFSIPSLLSCGVALKSANRSVLRLEAEYPDLEEVTGPPKRKRVELSSMLCSLRPPWRGGRG